MADTVTVERDGAVATVRLNRAPVNAIDPELLTGIGEAFTELGADDSVRCIVLASALERYFMAGADIKAMAAAGEGAAGDDPIGTLGRHLVAVERTPKPVIAAISGHALGGGCELALCCDYRLMIDDGHSTIGLSETSLGIIPGGGGTQRLPRLIGRATALHMIFEGTRLRAPEAARIGLVDEAIAPEAFAARVQERAAQVARLATRALGLAKLAVLDGMELPLMDGLRREREAFAQALGTADAAEGLGAFLAKRPPEFSGR